MKRYLTNLLAGTVAVLAILSFAGGASAQGIAHGRIYTKKDVGRIIKNVETRVDRFVGQ